MFFIKSARCFRDLKIHTSFLNNLIGKDIFLFMPMSYALKNSSNGKYYMYFTTEKIFLKKVGMRGTCL